MSEQQKTGHIAPADETDRLFHDWAEQEAHVDLSDLKWEDAVVFILFWALFWVVFLQFFTRYVLNNSIAWTEEIASYLLICTCFVGSILAMRKGSHIAVEAVLEYMPKGVRHWCLVTVEAVVAVFMTAMTFNAVQLAQTPTGFMTSIDVPKSWLYWVVAVAFGGITIYAAIRFWRRVTGRQSDTLHVMKLD